MNHRPGRNPNADYREGARMPTIQCDNCGAQYYSAASDERGPVRVPDAGVGYLAEEREPQAS
jgi:hypothetical protein